MLSNQFNLLFVAAIILSAVVFCIAYLIYLHTKYHNRKNLVLNGSYLNSLFDQMDSKATAVLGSNSEIDIEMVRFTEEDFRIQPFLKSLEDSFANF